MSTEARIKVVEELIRIRTEKLKVVKEEWERKQRAMASILESLEADKKELEQLKKDDDADNNVQAQRKDCIGKGN